MRTPDIVRDYEVQRYRAVPFCMPTAEAERLINERTVALLHAAERARDLPCLQGLL
jgi:hypothetical protein